VPIAQPLARRRDGRACAFYEQLFRWRPERIDAEARSSSRATFATS
jgi:predicted enzyme related to lactoylglutathione lyase